MGTERSVKRVVITILLLAGLGTAWLTGDTIRDLCTNQARTQQNVAFNSFAIRRQAQYPTQEGAVDVLGIKPSLVKRMLEQTVVIEINRRMSSGIVLDSKKGIVLTCNHCIRLFPDDVIIVQTFYGQRLEVDIESIQRYPEYDLAVLKVNKDLRVSSAKLSKSRVAVGDAVVVVGTPYNLTHSMSVGIISAINRTLRDDVVSFYQTDASLNPGNSGGPWFNSKGEVIAVSARKIMKADSIAFAIPIEYFLRAISK